MKKALFFLLCLALLLSVFPTGIIWASGTPTLPVKPANAHNYAAMDTAEPYQNNTAPLPVIDEQTGTIVLGATANGASRAEFDLEGLTKTDDYVISWKSGSHENWHTPTWGLFVVNTIENGDTSRNQSFSFAGTNYHRFTDSDGVETPSFSKQVIGTVKYDIYVDADAATNTRTYHVFVNDVWVYSSAPQPAIEPQLGFVGSRGGTNRFTVSDIYVYKVDESNSNNTDVNLAVDSSTSVIQMGNFGGALFNNLTASLPTVSLTSGAPYIAFLPTKLGTTYSVFFNVDFSEGWERNGLKLTLGANAVITVVKGADSLELSDDQRINVGGEVYFNGSLVFTGNGIRDAMVRRGNGASMMAYVYPSTTAGKSDVDFYIEGIKIGTMTAITPSGRILIGTIRESWGDQWTLTNVAIRNTFTPTVPTTPPTSSSSSTTSTTMSTTVTTQPTTRPTTAPSADEINVVTDYGVDNTGATDVTALLTTIHNTGKPVYYPNGTYLFNGKTLNFSGGVRFESQNGVVIRNSISATPIVNFDKYGNFIGLMQNHLEKKATKMQPFDKSGSLVSPPISNIDLDTKVEVLPFWYNDFGLTTRLMTWDGGITWYDWKWNHHDATGDGYDATRHPLLGYYFGDDPVVLDWQCYWLKNHGINQAALTNSGVNSDPTSKDYWVYQLLNNTPNAQNMDFALWVASTKYDQTYADYKSNWWKTFNEFYFNDNYKDQVYCYEENGKRYPVIWVWDESSIGHSLDKDNPSTLPNTIALYKEVAQAFQEKGYDGVCIMARTACMKSNFLPTLAAAGVKWFGISYPCNATEKKSTYEGRVNSFAALSDINTLYGVATGMESHTPHPSNWTYTGTTPALFETWLKKAVNATLSNSNRAKIVTCYNVSEWAEGGPGLQPTVGNGFGYLEAVYNAIVVNDSHQHFYDNACDTACNECGFTRTVGDHVYDGKTDTACNECGATRNLATITQQPKSAQAANGEKAKTTVKATGDGLKYQWYYKDTDDSKYKKSSTTSATYSKTMSKSYTGRKVYCVITDKYGNEVKSKTVTLGMKVSISTQPKTTYTKSGSAAKTTVKATGDGLKYQWYYKDTDDSKYSKSSTTSATYSKKMSSSTKDRKVYCVITDKYGNEVKSKTVTLRMAATVTTQPKSVTVAKNKTAKTTVKAAGDGLTYKWYYKNKGASKYSKSSITSKTYSAKMTSKANGRKVYCIVTDKYGKKVQTKTVTLKMK